MANDQYNGYGSTEIETETQQTTQTGYQSYTQHESAQTPYKDDYSVTPNYEEQQTYESKTQEEVRRSDRKKGRKRGCPH